MNYTDPFDGNDYGDEQEETYWWMDADLFWTEDDLMARRDELKPTTGLPYEAPQ